MFVRISIAKGKLNLTEQVRKVYNEDPKGYFLMCLFLNLIASQAVCYFHLD